MTRFMASERFSVSRILESAHTQATTALLWPVQVATLVGWAPIRHRSVGRGSPFSLSQQINLKETKRINRSCPFPFDKKGE